MIPIFKKCIHIRKVDAIPCQTVPFRSFLRFLANETKWDIFFLFLTTMHELFKEKRITQNNK